MNRKFNKSTKHLLKPFKDQSTKLTKLRILGQEHSISDQWVAMWLKSKLSSTKELWTHLSNDPVLLEQRHPFLWRKSMSHQMIFPILLQKCKLFPATHNNSAKETRWHRQDALTYLVSLQWSQCFKKKKLMKMLKASLTRNLLKDLLSMLLLEILTFKELLIIWPSKIHRLSDNKERNRCQ